MLSSKKTLQWFCFFTTANLGVEWNCYKKADRELQLFIFIVTFFNRPGNIFFSLLGRSEMLSHIFGKLQRKNWLFQIRRKKNAFRGKEPFYRKTMKFVEKTQFFAIKRTPMVLTKIRVSEEIQKSWRPAGFKSFVCGLFKRSATPRLCSASSNGAAYPLHVMGKIRRRKQGEGNQKNHHWTINEGFICLFKLLQLAKSGRYSDRCLNKHIENPLVAFR